MVKNVKHYLLLLFFCCGTPWLTLFAQQDTKDKDFYSVETGDKNINLEEFFTVSAIITTDDENSPIPECKFPDLKGLTKLGYTKKIARSFVAGHKLITYTITQNYKANREGTLKIKPFKVVINKTEQSAEGCVLTIKQATPEPANLGSIAPTETPLPEIAKSKNPKATPDAFFALNTSKKSIYVGEGFTVTLALYVSENNTVPMEFDHNEVQIPAITKQLKQASCWEENYDIEETITKQVTINGRKYTQYKFYQTSLYPLNKKIIRFPTVSLRVLTSEENEKGEKHFTPIRFDAKGWELHPLELPKLARIQQDVPVGNFSIEEHIDKTVVPTGKAIQCKIAISGDGNMSSIKLPEITQNPMFDFFPPKINMVTHHEEEKNVHTKTFTFQLIPKRAGNFVLSNYFKWVYFNPNKGTYDTLRSQLSFKAQGATISSDVESTTERSIYDELENLDSSKESSTIGKLLKNEANILIVIMLIGMVYIFIPRRNK